MDKRPENLPPNPHPAVVTNAIGEANYAVPRDDPFVGATHFNGVAINPANTGGVIYRGNKISQLYGAYVFADSVSGRIWVARPNGINLVPFQLLATDGGIAGFGVDPRNGDVLIADQSEDRIKRLVYNTTQTGTPLPATLADTGTNPLQGGDAWRIQARRSGNAVEISFPQSPTGALKFNGRTAFPRRFNRGHWTPRRIDRSSRRPTSPQRGRRHRGRSRTILSSPRVRTVTWRQRPPAKPEVWKYEWLNANQPLGH